MRAGLGYAPGAGDAGLAHAFRRGCCMNIRHLVSALFTAAMVAIAISFPSGVCAHCDGMDGPVVKAARAALEGGDVNLALVWVRRDDESEIRRAFARTVAVRDLSPAAKDLADLYFFETLVRIHRAGEGATYSGLKPAGRDLGPAIPAADRALENGNAELLLKLVRDAVEAGLRERFHKALAARNYRRDDLEAGREYVERYVTFLHYVEGVYESAVKPAAGHAREAEQTGPHGAEPH